MTATTTYREEIAQTEPMFTKPMLAKYLVVSERWIENQMHNGLPCKRLGTLVRFERADVMEWINNQQETQS